MNTRQLITFMQVIEKGNLSEAAKTLSLSQPAVTGIIKKLESQFEAELFIRNGKSLIPNNQGRLLYKMVKELMFTENLAKISLHTCGKIRKNICIAMDAYCDYFFTLIGVFSRLHPDYCFIFKSRAFSIGTDYYSPADFFLTYDHKINDRKKISIDMQNRLYAVLPVDHPLASHRNLDLLELQDEYFVFIRGAGPGQYEPCYNECVETGFLPKVFMTVDIPVAKYSAIAAGCGIGLVYNTKTKLAEATRNCILIDCKEAAIKQALCLTWGENLNEDALFFLEWLKKYRQGKS